MNCREIEQWFAERLDGRLDAAQLRRWEAHLAGCATCRQEWADYVAAWETLGQAPAPEPSVGFVERTMRRLETTPVATGPERWWLLLRWVAVGSALVVLSLGVWQGYQRAHRERLAQVYETVRGDVLESDVVESLDQL